MKVGLFFGSFNPVHNGHLILATHYLNEGLTDEVWFVVSPQNPFKDKKSLLNEQHRLFMVRAAIEGITRMKASNIEFGLPRPSYTIDTLIYLKEKYPSHEFSIILGADSLQNFNHWKNHQAILEYANLLVYPRPGFMAEILTGKGIQLTDAPLIEISSTRIRKLIKDKKEIRFLVPEGVKHIIEKENYYA